LSQAPSRKIVDLSHAIREGLITYPGLPSPVITPHLTREAAIKIYAAGTTFAMDLITMIGNTGTYLDSPFHRYFDGADLAGLKIETLVELETEVFDFSAASSRGIEASQLVGREISGKAVLLYTGWDKYFGELSYAKSAPYLSKGGAEFLVKSGVVLVGIDSLNIDDTESGGERPAHSLLLGAGIHIVEHLTNLGQLPATGARFTAAPPKVEGFGTFPVRAFATFSED
jgi:kynurenine formamidase